MNRDDPLDGLLGDVREAVRSEAERGGRKRDFAAMIARAHAIDPTCMPDAAVAEAAQFAPVVALPRLRLAPPPASTDVRAEAPAAARRRGHGWLVAAAAGLLLAGAFAGAATQARLDARSHAASAVPLVAPRPEPSTATAEPAPRDGVKGHAPKVMAEETASAAPAPAGGVRASEDMPQETCDKGAAPAEAPVRQEEAETTARRREGGAPRRVPARAAEATTDEAAWVALDRAAREAWRRGDTEEARALLTALVRSDATPATIELAYGDLFVLARQADEPQALARLWQRYLARFPRGLYAEDARVGLCRRASGAEARACWDMYLGTWPEGAHADEARGARGEGP